jgi:predicted secreted protein
MTSATLGHGTLLKQGNGAATEVFTTIAEVRDIGLGLSVDPVDVTNHGSTNAWRERIAGLKDGGEVSFDVNWIPTDATHDATTGVLNDMENGTARNFQIVFPDPSSTTWSFTAIVTAFNPSAPVGEQLSVSITFTVTGQPTLA